ncbi:thioredoxin family protein [Streptococcus macacae]|uniref:Hydrogenase-1 expression protein HyaE n=1 Tax=Streptococcus macacae NCTC 11558 TaxID=764298 RepID=G5JWC0_9STRE|nr:thioredoxin family protein [Streptococcus macacae]EHJ51988.1 hydrogenase-1 expression protein HyaE [Streptococcus macacae NCTC 11558]SUN77775.1 thioredoxin [Streptococcus macacae NCTC 11558]
MIIPKNLEELAAYTEKSGKQVFFFKADWCGDCQFIYPFLPEIEKRFPEMAFIQVDRDEYMALAQKWAIFGIPSFVVVENGKVLGRLVNRQRKTKEEIISFLTDLD